MNQKELSKMSSWEGMGTEAEISLFHGSGWASCPGSINLLCDLDPVTFPLEPVKYGE